MSNSINIAVDSRFFKGELPIEFSIEEKISDTDIKTFGLRDASLKRAVRKYHGKEPQDVYLQSPTPWGDMYKRYDWDPVTKTVEIVDSYVSSFQMRPVIVKTERIMNTSSVTAKYHSSISQDVTDTVSSKWSTGGNFDVDTKIEYSVKLLKGQVSFNYSNQWGRDKVVTKSHTLKSSSGLEVELEPGQGVLVNLRASRGVMKLKIDYETSLTGGTAVNYDPKYKGRSFKWFPIEDVMKSAKICNCIESSEIIEVSFFTNTDIDIEDI